MHNQEIREHAKRYGVRLWRVADRLGVSEGTFIRRLRKELPESERVKVLAIIDELAKETA